MFERAPRLLAPALLAGGVAISSTSPSVDASAGYSAEGLDPSLTDRLTVRLSPPSSLSWDSTALGRATHRFHVSFTNGSRHRVTVAPAGLTFAVVRDGVDRLCEAPEVERPTQSLAAGATVAIDVAVACETPLPGHYVVEVRGARTLTTAPLEIERGSTDPMRVPWSDRVWAAVNATKELRPQKDAPAHVAIALINGGGETMRTAPARAEVAIERRGKRLPACGHTMELASAEIPPGRLHAFEEDIPCDFSIEGLYDVRVVVTAEGGTVRLPTHTLRVAVIPVPHPGPTNRLPPSLTP